MSQRWRVKDSTALRGWLARGRAPLEGAAARVLEGGGRHGQAGATARVLK